MINKNLKKTEAGTIPKDWDVVSFGDEDFFEIGTGGTPDTNHPEYYDGGDIPFLRSGNVKGPYIEKAVNYINQLGYDNSPAKWHPPGSIMLAMSGRGATRGRSAILKIPCTCSQSVAAIIPKSDEIVPEFVHLNLVTRYNELRSLTGDADRSGLSLGLIRMVKIPKPSKDEQLEIADTFFSLYEKMRLLDKHMNLYQELFRESLYSIMSGKKRLGEKTN